MKTRIKICGIRRPDSAIAAIEAGADYIGFNFVKTSGHYINVIEAKSIIEKIPGKIQIVGIFQNMNFEKVNEIASDLKLNFVQLHGNEDMAYIYKIKSRIIKAVMVPSDSSLESLVTIMKPYDVDYFLLDRERQGTGNIIDNKLARKVSERFPIFFAGGLNGDNVASIIQNVRPYAIDVTGGVETNGKEDNEKIINFINKAKGVIL